ncbi:MAG: asparagine synthetase B family protein [Xanthomonadales bacterium]|nr:asparagine synthetase B family protein [Xanthomonadales bacterium]
MNPLPISGSWTAASGASADADPDIQSFEEAFSGVLYDTPGSERIPHLTEDRSAEWLARVKQAFEAKGIEGFNDLNGDYSAVFPVQQPERLILVRDHHGAGRWYVCRHEGRLYFASTLAALLDQLPFTPSLNLEHFAKLMTSSLYGDPTETAYREIQQIPPGHALIVHATGQEFRRYWTVPTGPSMPSPSSPAELADLDEAFLEVISAALRRRIDPSQRPAIALSAGLDSTTLACLAAEQLYGSGRRLDAYTAAPAFSLGAAERPGRLGDESRLAGTLCEQHAALHHHILDCKTTGLLEAMDELLTRLRRPVYAASNAYWLTTLCRTVRESDHDVLLTGQTGNATLSWPGNRTVYLRELLAARNWRALGSEWRAYRSVHDLDLVTAARKLILPVLLPDRWSEMLRQPRLENEALCRGTALNTDFARDIGLARQLRNSAPYPRSPHHALSRHRLLMAGIHAPAGEFAELAESYGLKATDPSADRQLIEWCFSQPESVFVGQGQTRVVLRRALHGRLPPAILDNPRKGLQAADIVARVRREQDALAGALGEIEADPTAKALVDVGKLRHTLEQAMQDDSAETEARVRSELVRGLMVGRMICRFPG